MTRSRRWLALPTALLASLIAGCAFLPWKHPELKSRRESIHRIGVLPPDIHAYRLTFKGDQEMLYDRLPMLKQETAEELVRALTSRGYSAQLIELTEATLAESPELKPALYTVQEIFEKRLKQARKRWFKKFRYSVGSAINPFADYADVDALVLARAVGIKKSGGEIASDLTKSVLIAAATLGSVIVFPYPSLTMVQVAVIDGNSGDILWYHENTGFNGFDITDEVAFRNAVFGLMRAFPKARAAAPPSPQP